MADFIFFLKDQNSDAKPRFAMPSLGPKDFEGIRGNWSTTLGSLWWNHASHTPFSHFEGPQGNAFVWGNAVAELSDIRLTARELYDRFSNTYSSEVTARALSRFSGLYAWLFIEKNGCCHIGVDPFGIFPLYYFQEGADFGFSTSLQALHAHSSYNNAVDPVGMFRYAIENGCASWRTLETSGRRLEMSSSLIFRRDTGQLKVIQHPIPFSQFTGKKETDERAAVEMTVTATRKSLSRSLFEPLDYAQLSGGLDSRYLLALAAQLGEKPKCVTMGRYSDYEAFFARRVARCLNLEWQVFDDSIDDLECDIEETLNRQSLGCGFSSVSLNGNRAAFAKGGGTSLTGIILDAHYVPYIKPGKVKEEILHSYDYAFANWINRFGVKPDALKGMCVNSKMLEALECAMIEIKEEWERIPMEGNDRLWWSLMRSRGRPHLGGSIWNQVYRVWPIAPALDLNCAETIRTVADQHFFSRKTQKLGMVQIDPRLARIPLATLSDSPRPITKNLSATMLKQYLRFRLRSIPKKQRSDLHRFSRTLGLDTPTWQIIKQLAEQKTPSLHPYFDLDKLENYISAADLSNSPNGIQLKNEGGVRFMLGLAIWMDRRDER